MKKILATLLGLVGVATAAPQEPKPQKFDLSSILYTTPTISNDIAALDPIDHQPGDAAFGFHEDEWCQVEFLPKAELPTVQHLLTEYQAFERENRAQHGWRNVFVRKLSRRPVVSGAQPVQQLERTLGIKAGAAPLIFSSGSVSGSARNGFSFPLGGNVTLYGYSDAQGIPVLGADVGANADDSKLTDAFRKLSVSNGLILVDWRAQLVLVSVAPSGEFAVWRP